MEGFAIAFGVVYGMMDTVIVSERLVQFLRKILISGGVPGVFFSGWEPPKILYGGWQVII